jgi:hypothetical protein
VPQPMLTQRRKPIAQRAANAVNPARHARPDQVWATRGSAPLHGAQVEMRGRRRASNQTLVPSPKEGSRTYSGRSLLPRAMSARAKGFGCRPIGNLTAGTEAGVRKPAGKEPAVGFVGVAVYGDLTAGRRARVTRWSARETVADPLRRSERRHCRFRQGDFGVMGGIARMFSGHAATGCGTGSASSGEWPTR